MITARINLIYWDTARHFPTRYFLIFFRGETLRKKPMGQVERIWSVVAVSAFKPAVDVMYYSMTWIMYKCEDNGKKKKITVIIYK